MAFGDTRGLWTRLWTRAPVRIAALLLVLGFIVDYVELQHSLGKWPDLFLPSVAFLFVSTGAVLFFFGLSANWLRRGLQRSLLTALLISVPLSSVHASYYAITKIFERGVDRYGECSQLIEIASESGAIPESPASPGQPALGCAVERYGMFLMPYNVLAVYGVTDPTQQAMVLQSLSDYRSVARTLPIRLKFYEHYNWIQHPGKSGPGWGERGQPERLLRIVYLR
jgi:hypothetical protein